MTSRTHMTPEDMFSDDDNPRGRELADKDGIHGRWAQARGELLGFANHLARSNGEITSDQLRFAIHLADRAMKQGNRIFESMFRYVLWRDTDTPFTVRVWRKEEELKEKYEHADLERLCSVFETCNPPEAGVKHLAEMLSVTFNTNAVEIVDKDGIGSLIYPNWP